MKNYDLAVIGAGWAGFNAALKAKDLGKKVCLIEKSDIGGTCLNLGCIPTKTLIQSVKIYALNKKSEIFGLENITPLINFRKVQERKENIILQLRQGMQYSLKGIDFINAQAKIISPEEIEAAGEKIKSKNILIATGSKSIELKEIKFDAKHILSSDEILQLKEIPGALLVIGGGVIGCEFASLFSMLGTQVTIIEKLPQLLPAEDSEVARKLETIFKKRGIKVNTNSDATKVNLSDYGVVLVCVGRAPRVDNLGLEGIGIKLERGRVLVDEYLRTSIPNIYAAGDCTGGIMLAHLASYQGKMAVENMVNPEKPKRADNPVVPNCIFTDPEIASVGLNAEQAKNKGIDIAINKFDFLGSGMARILEEKEGFIKVISDNATGEILGASIIGPRATELIAVLTLAISVKLKVSQFKDTIFAHPTISESISDALNLNHGI
ncbi:MAG: dihydrolipoyl dehydrogenase [Candidatus Omnitrophota bacterium]